MIIDRSQILHDALYEGPLTAVELSDATRLSIGTVWEAITMMERCGEIERRTVARQHFTHGTQEHQRVVFLQRRTNARSRA